MDFPAGKCPVHPEKRDHSTPPSSTTTAAAASSGASSSCEKEQQEQQPQKQQQRQPTPQPQGQAPGSGEWSLRPQIRVAVTASSVQESAKPVPPVSNKMSPSARLMPQLLPPAPLPRPPRPLLLMPHQPAAQQQNLPPRASPPIGTAVLPAPPMFPSAFAPAPLAKAPPTTGGHTIPTVRGNPLHPLPFYTPPPPLINPVPVPQSSTFSLTTTTTPPMFRNKKLRSGKWTREEEIYADRLIEQFVQGCITDCEMGVTLRSYLSQKLHCAPMRISKKYSGQGIGKMVYKPALPRVSAANTERLKQATQLAEAGFYKAVSVDVDFLSQQPLWGMGPAGFMLHPMAALSMQPQQQLNHTNMSPPAPSPAHLFHPSILLVPVPPPGSNPPPRSNPTQIMHAKPFQFPVSMPPSAPALACAVAPTTPQDQKGTSQRPPVAAASSAPVSRQPSPSTGVQQTTTATTDHMASLLHDPPSLKSENNGTQSRTNQNVASAQQRQTHLLQSHSIQHQRLNNTVTWGVCGRHFAGSGHSQQGLESQRLQTVELAQDTAGQFTQPGRPLPHAHQLQRSLPRGPLIPPHSTGIFPSALPGWNQNTSNSTMPCTEDSPSADGISSKSNHAATSARHYHQQEQGLTQYPLHALTLPAPSNLTPDAPASGSPDASMRGSSETGEPVVTTSIIADEAESTSIVDGDLPDFLTGFDRIALKLKAEQESKERNNGFNASSNSKPLTPIVASLQCSPPMTSRSFDDFHQFLGNVDYLAPLDDEAVDTIAAPSDPASFENNVNYKASTVYSSMVNENSLVKEPGPSSKKPIMEGPSSAETGGQRVERFDTMSLFSAECYAMFAQESAMFTVQHPVSPTHSTSGAPNHLVGAEDGVVDSAEMHTTKSRARSFDAPGNMLNLVSTHVVPQSLADYTTATSSNNNNNNNHGHRLSALAVARSMVFHDRDRIGGIVSKHEPSRMSADNSSGANSENNAYGRDSECNRKRSHGTMQEGVNHGGYKSSSAAAAAARAVVSETSATETERASNYDEDSSDEDTCSNADESLGQNDEGASISSWNFCGNGPSRKRIAASFLHNQHHSESDLEN